MIQPNRTDISVNERRRAMKRMLLIGALTVGASLATAQAAEAKGYVRAIRVCGPSGCAPVRHPRAAMQRFGMDMLSDAGPHAERPPLLPYYRLRFLPSYEVPNSDAFYIPGAKVICTDGGCIHVRRGLVPDDRALLAGLVRDVCFGNARRYFAFEGLSDEGGAA